MPFKILVVDDKIDDPSEEISELPRLLRRAGYEVRTATDETEGLDLYWEYRPDLLVLDIMFGNYPAGVEICDSIRQSQDETPIILVTRFRKETQEVLDGFDAGADDYVILPCDNLVIMARIRANLPPEAVVVNDYIQVDFDSYQVWICRDRDWQLVHLAPRLWKLLDVLLLNAGITVVTTTIKDRVWSKFVSDGALHKAVHDLREKLEPNPDHPVYIETVRSIGYRFNGTPIRASSTPPPTLAPQGDLVLRERLMVHAGIAVERLLAGRSKRKDLQPSDIVQLVRAAGRYVEEQFTSVLAGE